MLSAMALVTAMTFQNICLSGVNLWVSSMKEKWMKRKRKVNKKRGRGGRCKEVQEGRKGSRGDLE